MTYTSFEALCEAVSDMSQESLQEKQGRNLTELLKVYFDAWNNPPAGIIGVGAITYAESVLIDYQLKQVSEN